MCVCICLSISHLFWTALCTFRYMQAHQAGSHRSLFVFVSSFQVQQVEYMKDVHGPPGCR